MKNNGENYLDYNNLPDYHLNNDADWYLSPYSFNAMDYNPNYMEQYSKKYNSSYVQRSENNDDSYDNDYEKYETEKYENEKYKNEIDYDNDEFNDNNDKKNKNRKNDQDVQKTMDYGPYPIVFNINEVTKQNDYYRNTLWTGNHMQLTLMSIDVGEDIGLEIHPNVDQFLRVEDGQGLVRMGYKSDNLNMEKMVSDDDAIIVPAGTWHNVINTGRKPLKMYSIYAPVQHPKGTVHKTKEEAENASKRRKR